MRSLPLLRGIFIGYWLLTAAYGLLAYDTYTWTHVLQLQLTGWLPAFAVLHPWLYWGAQGAAYATLPRDPTPRARNLRRGFALVSLAGGSALVMHPILVGLQNKWNSFDWCLLALVPVLLLAGIDFALSWRQLSPRRHSEESTTGLLRAAIGAAFLVWALSAAGACWRARGTLPLAQSLTPLIIALVVQLLAASAVFVGLTLLLRLARRSLIWELVLAAVTIAAAIGLILLRLVFPSLAFRGGEAVLLAAAVALTVSASLAGTGLRLTNGQARSGLGLLLRPLLLAETGPLRWALPICCAGWVLKGESLGALACWGGSFAALLRARPTSATLSTRWLLAPIGGALVFLAGCTGLAAHLSWSASPEALVSVARYGTFDGSFRMLADAIGWGAGLDSALFFDALRRSRTAPAPLGEGRLGGELRTEPAAKPDLFIFVVEGLRRDSLSPFNPAVTSTPEIAAFARESDAFTNAFTRYGAELSEPSIWRGGMMPDGSALPPNSLKELVEAEHYRSFEKLEELEAQLEALKPGEPVFGCFEIKEGIAPFDARFGRFLGRLKANGRYDHSIIVMTSNHGRPSDEGAALAPEVMRVPLIVHLPPQLRGQLSTDTADLAFSTDLTPTLYALLGHPLLMGEPLFGVSLYSTTAEPRARHVGPQLVVAADGPAYGLVLDQGRRLYVADTRRFSDEAFEIGAGETRLVPITPEERARNQRRILETIRTVEAFYGAPSERGVAR